MKVACMKFYTHQLLRTKKEIFYGFHSILKIKVWLFKSFCVKFLTYNIVHNNYVGHDDKFGHYVISIKEDMTTHNMAARVILWLNEGIERRVIKLKHKSQSLDPSEILKIINPNLSRKKLKEIKSKDIERELETLEEKTAEMKKTFKFGVLYVKPGQKTEEEMFANCNPSAEFQKFLDLLGTRIKLKDWDGFSGGLDIGFNRSGKESIYCEFCGYEIMYHVSTLLPYTENDPQQIERKKHVGNDIVIIVFQDSDTNLPWIPTTISSKFPHIYAVVRPEAGGYRLALNIKNNVNNFGPPLPYPSLFMDPKLFITFLVAKLINGERAAIRSSPDFKQNESFKLFLKEIYEKYYNVINITLFPDAPRKQKSFNLKVQSTFTQAFQVKEVVKDLPITITCSDSWGDIMVVGTTDGLYLVDREKQDKLIKVLTQQKKSNKYKQINVIDNLGILVTFVKKVGIVVYDLSTLDDQIDGPAEFQVEMSKHTSFYCYGTYDNSLYLCCVVKSTLFLYRWENDTFCPTQKIELPGLVKVAEFNNIGQVIVGLENEFAVITLGPDDPTYIPLYSWKDFAVPVDVLVLEDNKYLLCFDHVGIFVNSLGHEMSFKIKWNATPLSFVNIYPYLLVFTYFHVEVRTLSNGSLVQTIGAEDNNRNVRFLTTINGIYYTTCALDQPISSIFQLRIVAHQSSPKKPFVSPPLARRVASTPLLSLSPDMNVNTMSGSTHTSPIRKSRSVCPGYLDNSSSDTSSVSEETSEKKISERRIKAKKSRRKGLSLSESSQEENKKEGRKKSPRKTKVHL